MYKWFLRQLAADRIPRQLVSAPKVGLAVPLREWLRGDLGVKVAGLVASAPFGSRGVFDRLDRMRAVTRIERDGGTTGTRSGRWRWSSCGIGRSSIRSVPRTEAIWD